jgi:hypothetical protein
MKAPTRGHPSLVAIRALAGLKTSAELLIGRHNRRDAVGRSLERTSKLAANRPGTGSSNPSPSSGESANPRFLSPAWTDSAPITGSAPVIDMLTLTLPGPFTSPLPLLGGRSGQWCRRGPAPINKKAQSHRIRRCDAGLLWCGSRISDITHSLIRDRPVGTALTSPSRPLSSAASVIGQRHSGDAVHHAEHRHEHRACILQQSGPPMTSAALPPNAVKLCRSHRMTRQSRMRLGKLISILPVNFPASLSLACE